MDYQALGKRVRKQRLLSDMTQEDLAEAAGISCSFVGHIERGEKKASLETLIALCNAMQVSPNVLLQDSLDNAFLEEGLVMEDGKLVSDIMKVLREHKQDTPYR